MVYLWFLLALLLLVAAIALLWLDRRQRTRRDASAPSPALDSATEQGTDSDYWMTSEHGDSQTPSDPALLAGSAGADPVPGQAPRAQVEADPAEKKSKPPVRPAAAAAGAGAAAAGAATAAGVAATAGSGAADAHAVSDAPAGDPVTSPDRTDTPDSDQSWTPPTSAPMTPPFAAGSPSSDDTARLTKISDADAMPAPGGAGSAASAAALDAQPGSDQSTCLETALTAESTTPAEPATPVEPTDDTSDYYGVMSDSEQAEPSGTSAKPGRMQRLKERLSGAKKGAVAAGAAAAGAAGAVAAKRRGKNADTGENADSPDADTVDATAQDTTGQDADQDAGQDAADQYTAAPDQVVDLQDPAAGHDADATTAPTGIAQRTEPQQQWLASRGFAPDSQGAENVYRGRFRGAETTLLFAERQLHVSLRRPGPNTTEFSLERSSTAGQDGATVEQMNLRSADESTDALLTDQRVVRALRGAPAEFSGATVDAQWAHTSIPVDAVDSFDATIVTLHGLVAAASALPTKAGAAAPLDLSHSDPGSAAESRGGQPGIGMGTPSAPQPVATDSDAVSLGDDRLDDALATEVPKASASDKAAAAPADQTSAEPGSGERTLSPEDVPLAPRRPGRPGHLRLVKPADEAPAADASEPATAGADSAGPDASSSDTSGSGTTADSRSGGGKVAGAAAATGIAAALAGAAGLRKKNSDSGAAATADSAADSDATSGAEVDEFAPITDGAAAEALSEAPSTAAGTAYAAAADDADAAGAAGEGEDIEQAAAEPNPFDAAMRSDDVPANRGDVAADFLPERPAAPRPSRGAAATFGTGAEMPSLGEPELGRHEAETGEEFKALGASEEAPADTRESISEEMRRFESTRVGGVDEPGEADEAQADAAEAAAQRAELSNLAPHNAETDSADVEPSTSGVAAGAAGAAAAKDGESGTGGEGDAKDTVDAGEAASGGRRGRHAGANPNALSIADLLAREAGSGAARGTGTRSADRGAGRSAERDETAGGSTDPDFVETTRFPQIKDPNAE